LPDGSFLVGNADYTSTGDLSKLEALLYPPYNGAWIQTGLGKQDGNTEQGYTLLPVPPLFATDPKFAMVMTVDTYHGFGHYGTPPTPICPNYPTGSPGWHSSELYVRDSGFFNNGAWGCLGDTQVQLWAEDPNQPQSWDEMGPAILRPDGTVFQAGANVNSATAILGTDYKWTVGPTFPKDRLGNVLTISDGPAALLPNGNVLMMAAPGRDTGPGTFLELTSGTNQLVEVHGVSYANRIPGSSYGEMLVLPTGQILFSPNRCSGCGIEIYTPDNPNYDPTWAPHILDCGFGCGPHLIHNSQTNVITGKRFNGMSQGAAFGDEYQSATNYPLVRIQVFNPPQNNNFTPLTTYYCRTHDHSYMGVATGDMDISTQFDCPNLPLGAEGILQVVANGIPSNSMFVYIGN
jgi:hypothetical protein